MKTKNEFGQVFKQLRESTGFSYAALKSFLSKTTIVRFEAGEALPHFDKLASALAAMGFSMQDYMYLVNSETKIFQQYGRVFHRIRRQRGYRKDFFENLGVNRTRLELFENGKIMFPYDILDEMLLQMSVPESDYAHWINNGALDYFTDCIEQLEKAYMNEEWTKVKEIEKLAHTMGQFQEKPKSIPDNDSEYDYTSDRLTRQYTDYRVLELTAKARYTSLSDSEQVEISDFLMGIEDWTEFGLSIFALNGRDFSFSFAEETLKDFVKDWPRYSKNLHYRQRIVQAGIRCAITQLSHNEVSRGRELLSLVTPFAFDLDTYLTGMLRFTEALADYISGNPQGKLDMLHVIETFDFYELKSSRDYAQSLFDKYVLKIK